MNGFRRCLEELDIPGARELWAETHPHLHQPETDEQMLIQLHRARTEADSIPLTMRVYSHEWLVERNLPSGLPDDLKPPSQQPPSKIVTGVGIAVAPISPDRAQLATEIEKAMSDAVLGAYADGNKDPIFVKARMEEARRKVMRSLGG